ncbi:MAG: hypothetical protein ABIJ34_08720 [archaeon]
MIGPQRSETKKFNLVTFLRKNFKLIILAGIAMILFNRYVILIVLTAIFTVMGVETQKISRIVPHINVETITPSSILIGYLYGWKIGLLFGLGLGMYSFFRVSLIKLTSITSALLMALSAVLADLFKSLGFSFYIAFIIVMVIRSNIGFFLFNQINPDMLENFMHGYVEGLFHIFITLQLMQVIYIVVSPLI